MRYCLLMHYQEGPDAGLTEEDMAPAMAAFQQYADDLSAAGVLIGTEVLESVDPRHARLALGDCQARRIGLGCRHMMRLH